MNISGYYQRLEATIARFLAWWLKSKTSVMVDVGAHSGSVSDPFVAAGWNVYCFEPEASNRALLKERFRDKTNVVISKEVVTDSVGQAEFHISSDHWGIHSVRPFHSSHAHSELMPCTTLSRYFSDAKIDAIRLLKVDVEGAEMKVLKGLDWARWRPDLVILEFYSERTEAWFGYAAADLVNFMTDKGYETYVFEYGKVIEYAVKGKPSPHKLSRVYRWNGSVPREVFGNFYFVSRKSIKFLRGLFQILPLVFFLARTINPIGKKSCPL